MKCLDFRGMMKYTISEDESLFSPPSKQHCTGEHFLEIGIFWQVMCFTVLIYCFMTVGNYSTWMTSSYALRAKWKRLRVSIKNNRPIHNHSSIIQSWNVNLDWERTTPWHTSFVSWSLSISGKTAFRIMQTSLSVAVKTQVLKCKNRFGISSLCCLPFLWTQVSTFLLFSFKCKMRYHFLTKIEQ